MTPARFAILGPFEITDGTGGDLALGGPKQRALLAILLLRANTVVPDARLIDGLWGEQSPPAAAKTTQVYVSKLRRHLGSGAGRRDDLSCPRRPRVWRAD